MRKNTTRPGVCLAVGCLLMVQANGQTKVDLSKQGRSFDFSQAVSTKPNKTGTTRPSTCTTGETFFKTDAPAGQNQFGCTAPNVWSLLANGGIPAEHGETHRYGGTDQLGQEIPAGHAIPRADEDGRLAIGWVASGVADGTRFVRDDGTLQTPVTTAIQRNPVVPGAPAADGQFYGWNPLVQAFTVFTFGDLFQISGSTVNLASEVLMRYSTSTAIPGNCSGYGRVHFDPAGAAGGKMLYCNGSTYERLTGGSTQALADPGSNGIVKRTALNTTVTAVAGTDYYAPGVVVARQDLPTPTAIAGGAVRSKTCSAGEFVNQVAIDGSVTCSAPAGGGASGGGTVWTMGALTAIGSGLTRYYWPGVTGPVGSAFPVPVPRSGTVTALQIWVTAPAAGQTFTATVQRNGSDQPTCSVVVTGPATTGSAACNIAYAAGDTFQVKGVNSATSGSLSTQMSVNFQ